MANSIHPKKAQDRKEKKLMVCIIFLLFLFIKYYPAFLYCLITELPWTWYPAYDTSSPVTKNKTWWQGRWSRLEGTLNIWVLFPWNPLPCPLSVKTENQPGSTSSVLQSPGPSELNTLNFIPLHSKFILPGDVDWETFREILILLMQPKCTWKL